MTLIELVLVTVLVSDWWAKPAVLAGTFTVAGGILLKITERFLSQHAEQRSDRHEYRDEIKELHERVDKLEEQVSTWRDRYYAEQEETALLRLVLIQNGLTIPAKNP